MRSTVRILVVMALALGAVALAAIPSGAGATPTNTVIVEKHVTGPVPVGTTFTVEVNCESELTPVAQAPTVITFDATGAATSDNSVTTSAGTVCTATETEDGTAVAVAYQCTMEHGATDDEAPFLGNCTGDNEATFTDVIGDTATITVTNSFATPPPNQQPITPVAQAVQAAPAFTG